VPGQWVALPSLTGLYNMDCTICEGKKVDCCDMIPATSDFDMIIFMPDRLYSMLSCQLVPIQCPARVVHATCG
jgi:hypothetical protein